MKRYVIRRVKARQAETGDWDEEAPPRTSIEVSEADQTATFTGLYDASGARIFSVPEPVRPAFVRFGDE